MPAERAELVSLRVTVAGVMRKPSLERFEAGGAKPAEAASRGSRPVYFSESGGFVDTPVFDRDHLLAENRISGPALVEEYASTTLLLPGDELVVDGFGNLIISVGASRP